jgi:hypothetical protein
MRPYALLAVLAVGLVACAGTTDGTDASESEIREGCLPSDGGVADVSDGSAPGDADAASEPDGGSEGASGCGVCEPTTGLGCAADEACTAVNGVPRCVPKEQVATGATLYCNVDEGRFCGRGFSCGGGMCFPFCGWTSGAPGKYAYGHPDCYGHSGFGSTCAKVSECGGICVNVLRP